MKYGRNWQRKPKDRNGKFVYWHKESVFLLGLLIF